MDSAVTIIILVGIVGGFVIGAVTGFLAGKKSRSPADLPKQDLVQQKEAVREQIKTGTVHEGYRPLFGLWRKKDGSALAFEIDEKLYTERGALTPDAVRILSKTGYEWLAWLGVPEPAPAPEVKSAVPEPVTPTPVQPARPPVDAPAPLPPEHAASVDSRKMEADPERKIYRTDSITNQVDAVLQEKLAAAGLGHKGIRITEDLNHEVIFMVGLKSYRSLDAVDDPEALQIIRAAIADWERRTKPLNRR